MVIVHTTCISIPTVTGNFFGIAVTVREIAELESGGIPITNKEVDWICYESETHDNQQCQFNFSDFITIILIYSQ
jgi:hypothetical protein